MNVIEISARKNINTQTDSFKLKLLLMTKTHMNAHPNQIQMHFMRESFAGIFKYNSIWNASI